MLCSAKELKNFAIVARDGEIGKVKDLLFDDALWVVRHLVVDTGGWLTGRTVLVSPHAVQRVDLDGRRVEVALARKQVEEAPGIESDRPVSRQHEMALYDYYGYPYYWAGASAWGMAAFPLPAVTDRGAGGGAGRQGEPDAGRSGRRDQDNPHLRSCAEVTDYRIEASDGAIGHVQDFLVDPRSWHVRDIVVDTRNWLPGRHVLVEPATIEAVDWNERQVRVRLTRGQVKAAPERDTVA